MFTGKGNKQVLANNDEISLALKKNKGKSSQLHMDRSRGGLGLDHPHPTLENHVAIGFLRNSGN